MNSAVILSEAKNLLKCGNVVHHSTKDRQILSTS